MSPGPQGPPGPPGQPGSGSPGLTGTSGCYVCVGGGMVPKILEIKALCPSFNSLLKA